MMMKESSSFEPVEVFCELISKQLLVTIEQNDLQEGGVE